MSDLISRADAIEAMCSKCLDRDVCTRIVGTCESAIAVAELPSVDAVQGEWVCKEREYNDCDGYYAHYWYECSVCGARPPKNQWKNEWHSNFCPSCGARMKGGAE